MIKLILKLLWHKASMQQWRLQIGARLLEQGTNLKIGDVIGERKLAHNHRDIYKCDVIVGLSYNFEDKKVYPRTVKKVINPATNHKAQTPPKKKRKKTA